MYSSSVISRNLAAVEAKFASSGRKLSLEPRSIAYIDAATEHLATLIDESGAQTREFTPDESEFVLSERILCKFDFRYWVERYGYCYADDARGSIHRVTLWQSQTALINLLGTLEDDMYARRDQGETSFDGLCVIVHKARQLGFTMLIQLLAVQRINFYGGIRGVTGSVNDEKTQLIYIDRFKVALDRQPWWLATPKVEDVKDRGLKLANNSRMQLQDATQKAGFAQGNQYDFAHLSECASWPDPANQIQNHFFPTIPRSIRASAFLEGTAQSLSRGGPIWWKRAFEQAAAGRLGRWHALFIPWYAEPGKYRAYPHEGWAPSPATLHHAELVENSSPRFMSGKTIRLSPEQLYWYEREYESARESGALNLFLANYCATPEESFQHGGVSTFSMDVLQSQQAHCFDPVPYELYDPLVVTPDRIYLSDTPGAPQPYTISPHTLTPVRLGPADPLDDPRGLILVWEPPDPRASYFIGVDTAGGIPNWSRHSRTQNDDTSDNGVISIWRHARTGDVQVAEYAGPVEEQTLALYAYLLGRMFAGADETGEAPMIIEVAPKGLACQQALAYQYGYSNFYRWQRIVDGVLIDDTDQFGWQSNRRSMQALWAHGRYHINQSRVIVRSRWLVSELRTCINDPLKHRAAAMSGFHDDRVIAAMLALWMANGWSSFDFTTDPAERQPSSRAPVQTVAERKATWQESDMTYEQMLEAWDRRMDEIMDS
jgi:hypothetical protein